MVVLGNGEIMPDVNKFFPDSRKRTAPRKTRFTRSLSSSVSLIQEAVAGLCNYLPAVYEPAQRCIVGLLLLSRLNRGCVGTQRSSVG